MSQSISCGECGSTSCSAGEKRSGESDAEFSQRQELARRMCSIKHKVLVLSGKGGVGKSTVAVNLAASLASSGNKVGLLDVDLHGPSVPRLLGLDSAPVSIFGDSLLPVEYSENLKVMSVGFLLKGDDDAVIWRGPRKYSAIMQFLKDVEWGELDYLIVDLPPGTGDEAISVCQLIENADGAVVVTTPQGLALLDVRKSISFCKAMNLRVLGVVENMSGFVCSKCGERTEIFANGGADRMAAEAGVPFMGRIPIDPGVGAACDQGVPHVFCNDGSETAKSFTAIAELVKSSVRSNVIEAKRKEDIMKIAIPVAEGKLAMHFGHCAQFVLIDVDPVTKTIIGSATEVPPPHEPGVLPAWLSKKGANVIIAGGMGSRAQGLFAEQGIKVVVGASADEPETLVRAYLSGNLVSGANVCDH